MVTPAQLAVDGQVRFGRFDARPTTADPLAGVSGPRRWWRRTRLKEWAGFLVLHPDWSSSFITQDAKYLASSEFFAYHRASDSLSQHEAVGPPGSLRMPMDLPRQHLPLRPHGLRAGVRLRRRRRDAPSSDGHGPFEARTGGLRRPARPVGHRVGRRTARSSSGRSSAIRSSTSSGSSRSTTS